MTSSAHAVARKDILALKPYTAGAQVDRTIRLNANEAPVCPWDDNASDGLNRYPEARPERLRARLARLLDLPAEHLLVTRGSSEAIDALIRAFCTAYSDSVITTPPTFEMYRVYADIQGVELIDVPLDRDSGFALDSRKIIANARDDTKLIFLCAPNNPTGSMIAAGDVADIAAERRNRSIVVLDEAYIEFAERDSLAPLVAELDNLVVLRTLSKAQALAGARCGVAIACPELIEVISRVLPPYTFPTPVVRCVTDALQDERLAESAAVVRNIIDERKRVQSELAKFPAVRCVWPSSANFLLVEFGDLPAVKQFLEEDHILIRDFSSYPDLENCARITIGTADENDALLRALTSFGDRQSE